MLKQGNNLNSSQYLISAKRKFTKTDPFQNDSREFLTLDHLGKLMIKYNGGGDPIVTYSDGGETENTRVSLLT